MYYNIVSYIKLQMWAIIQLLHEMYCFTDYMHYVLNYSTFNTVYENDINISISEFIYNILSGFPIMIPFIT